MGQSFFSASGIYAILPIVIGIVLILLSSQGLQLKEQLLWSVVIRFTEEPIAFVCLKRYTK